MLGSAVRKVKRKILDILKDRDVLYDKYDKHYYARIRGESKVDLVHRSEVPEEKLDWKHRQMEQDELEERPEVEPGDDLDGDEEDEILNTVSGDPRRDSQMNPTDDLMAEARQYSYSQELPSQTARKAGSNRFIMSDVMNDPSIIDADSRVEAKAMIDAAQPGKTSTSYSDVAAEGDSGDSGEAGDSGDSGGSGEVSVADNPAPSTDVDAYAEAASSSSGDGSSSGGDSGFGSAGDSGAGDAGAGDSGIGGNGL